VNAPVRVAEGRSLLVPPGMIVRTGYVRIDRVRLACRDRMAIGDVERAYERRIQNAPGQPWPCARGEWDGEIFVVVDGRHDYVAALMLGVEWLLVAWLAAKPPDT
jgi:hypothetical protein